MASRGIDSTKKSIDVAVDAYRQRVSDFAKLAERIGRDLGEHAELIALIHSVKYRPKDPDHLRGKLLRKAKEAKAAGKIFSINASNLFKRIDDLAGVRILHIHSQQIKQIDPKIQAILSFHRYKHVRKPVANTWDIENQKLYKELGFNVALRSTLYTSIHYVVEPHFSRDRCEIQVRTLAEELWGEVSHTVDYPEPTRSIACQEQLKVLARVTSGCTRLVDSIFRSREEFEKQRPPRQKPRKKMVGT